jgi:hypothetical protein
MAVLVVDRVVQEERWLAVEGHKGEVNRVAFSNQQFNSNLRSRFRNNHLSSKFRNNQTRRNQFKRHLR